MFIVGENTVIVLLLFFEILMKLLFRNFIVFINIFENFKYGEFRKHLLLLQCVKYYWGMVDVKGGSIDLKVARVYLNVGMVYLRVATVYLKVAMVNMKVSTVYLKVVIGDLKVIIGFKKKKVHFGKLTW